MALYTTVWYLQSHGPHDLLVVLLVLGRALGFETFIIGRVPHAVSTLPKNFNRRRVVMMLEVAVQLLRGAYSGGGEWVGGGVRGLMLLSQ